MKNRELINLGFPRGPIMAETLRAVGTAARNGYTNAAIRALLTRLIDAPANYVEDPHFGSIATALLDRKKRGSLYIPRTSAAPYRRWGQNLDPQSVQQMENACALPVAVKGALMPDAHVGYGLPIGGVLATRGAVIPYAVGVDIACRMKLTVLDLPPSALAGQTDRLENAIHEETRFGVGASFTKRRTHDVMDEDWDTVPLTRRLKDKAWSQLGTSGSGNHFVEFGELTVEHEAAGLPKGVYLALLSHSGSRGSGSEIAGYYSRLAMEQRSELPKDLAHLAWLELTGEAGQEYWRAMELMGQYAAANHACIHRHIARRLGADVLLDLENHHNFAWKEIHDGEEVIVHRKGATPAGVGVLGIIPGSMASPAYVVRGKGVAASLNSASHGAGRRMSRNQAKASFTWSETKKLLRDRGVRLVSAGLDEVPMAYKDIDEVMAAQSDLVDPLARFFPRLVKMAPPGERPED